MQFDGRARVSTRIDMAPLIDVVFLLLIFFLLTSSFVSRQAINVDLPASSTADAAPESPIVVSILADGSLRVDGEGVDEVELTAVIAAHVSDTPSQEIAVQADKAVGVARLLTVLDAVREGGGEAVSLMTEPGTDP